jgi:hypothetical protein
MRRTSQVILSTMKTFKSALKIFVIIFMSTSCGRQINTNNQSIPTINWVDFLTLETSDLKLSGIADSISYVKLLTPAGVVVGNLKGIDMSQDKVIIVDETGTVFIFKKDGSLLTKFCHIGRGPGEYRNASDVAFDTQNRIIALTSDDDKKVLYYDFDGTFLKDINLNDDPIAIRYLGNALFLTKLTPTPFSVSTTEPLSSLVINEQGEIVQKHNYTVKEKSGPKFAIRYQGTISKSKEGAIIYEPFNDTIYIVSDKGLRKPYLINNLDKYKAPRQAYEAVQFYPKYGSVYFSLPITHFLNNYVLTSFRYNKLTYNGLFDLKLNKTYLLEKNNKISGLVDDLDSGLPLIWPGTIIENNIIDFLDPAKLIKDNSINPKKNSQLQKIMSNLHDTDNPIIRIIKTKTKIKFSSK